LIVTDIRGQPFGFIFGGEAVVDGLTLEEESDWYSRNVYNYQSTERNIPEERKSQLSPSHV